MQILVRNNNVDQALRVLKKKMQREGIFREMKRRRFYEKPSVRATRDKAGRAVRIPAVLCPARTGGRGPHRCAQSRAETKGDEHLYLQI